MNVRDTLRDSMLRYPEMHSSAGKVLYHMFFVGGNGYYWDANGEFSSWSEYRDEHSPIHTSVDTYAAQLLAKNPIDEKREALWKERDGDDYPPPWQFRWIETAKYTIENIETLIDNWDVPKEALWTHYSTSKIVPQNELGLHRVAEMRDWLREFHALPKNITDDWMDAINKFGKMVDDARVERDKAISFVNHWNDLDL